MKEGDRCRVCYTPLVRKERSKKCKGVENLLFVYAWCLFCPNCKRQYNLDRAKMSVEEFFGKKADCPGQTFFGFLEKDKKKT